MELNYSDETVVKNKKSIFLAGPTPRGENALSWRKEAVKILEENNFSGLVYIPEYSTWKPKEDYVDQAMWERNALESSTIIVFWIPRELPDMPAFTTNVEFGYWLHAGNVLYGRPDGTKKTKYLDWLYKYDYKKDVYNNLEDLLIEAIKEADLKYDGKERSILPLEERKIMDK